MSIEQSRDSAATAPVWAEYYGANWAEVQLQRVIVQAVLPLESRRAITLVACWVESPTTFWVVFRPVGVPSGAGAQRSIGFPVRRCTDEPWPWAADLAVNVVARMQDWELGADVAEEHAGIRWPSGRPAVLPWTEAYRPRESADFDALVPLGRGPQVPPESAGVTPGEDWESFEGENWAEIQLARLLHYVTFPSGEPGRGTPVACWVESPTRFWVMCRHDRTTGFPSEAIESSGGYQPLIGFRWDWSEVAVSPYPWRTVIGDFWLDMFDLQGSDGIDWLGTCEEVCGTFWPKGIIPEHLPRTSPYRPTSTVEPSALTPPEIAPFSPGPADWAAGA